jgi:uncharacterized protein
LRYEFDWDASKELTNVRKHRLSFHQAATVFRDPDQLSIYDDEHSDDEERWITLGLDNAGVLRVVVHTFALLAGNRCRIRIISARRATRAEETQYRETKP